MKNKILKIAALSLVLLVAGCDKVTATPSNVNDNLVTFEGSNEDYFRNDIQYIYDELAKSSTFNTITIEKIINDIVKAKVDNGNFFKNVDVLRTELIEDELLNSLNSDSYKINGLFSEKKFLNSVNKSVYNINVAEATLHEDISIKPDTKVKDILGDNYRSVYADYIDNEILPNVNKKLLTARYICENSFSSLSRAYARKLSYVKLDNMEKKPGAAGQLLNDWLGDFVNNKKVTTADGKFDLDSLARIYKGIDGKTEAENEYINSHYTLKDEISDEIDKICDIADNYKMKSDIGIDKSIEDKYTSSGSYTIAWGHELALRNLNSKKLSDKGLFTKTNGISELPSAVTDRLFSSSVSSYLKDVEYTVGEATEKVSFLTPLTSENNDGLGQYYFFDSATNAYYIVVVENYNYTSTNLKKDTTYDDDNNVIGVSDDTARIALALSTTGSYSNESLNDVLKEAKIVDHIHDQTFYDYMKDNYPSLFD